MQPRHGGPMSLYAVTSSMRAPTDRATTRRFRPRSRPDAEANLGDRSPRRCAANRRRTVRSNPRCQPARWKRVPTIEKARNCRRGGQALDDGDTGAGVMRRKVRRQVRRHPRPRSIHRRPLHCASYRMVQCHPSHRATACGKRMWIGDRPRDARTSREIPRRSVGFLPSVIGRERLMRAAARVSTATSPHRAHGAAPGDARTLQWAMSRAELSRTA